MVLGPEPRALCMSFRRGLTTSQAPALEPVYTEKKNSALKMVFSSLKPNLRFPVIRGDRLAIKEIS